MTKTHADGRVARGERTRRAIVDAQWSLIHEGDLRPTARAIADRAGVSVRALWSNFGDMEALFAASGQAYFAEEKRKWTPVPVGFTLDVRIDRYCSQRADALEALYPIARAASLHEPFSAQLCENRRLNVAWMLAIVRETFAPEIEAADGGSRAVVLADALVLVSGFNAWMSCREALGRSIAESHALMRHGVRALLRADG